MSLNFKSNNVNELSDVKKIKPVRGEDYKRSMATYALTFAIIVACIIALNKYISDAKTNVDIAVLKQDALGQQVMSENIVKKGSIYKKDYKEDMIKYNEIEDKLLKKSANYYLRKDTPLYTDQFTDEKALRQRYMYEMTSNEELVTIKFNTLEAGGTVLMPGDKIRMRISYVEKDPYTGDELRLSKILFDTAVVKDMLNSDGVSIYEKYREIWSKTEEEKQKELRDEKFLDDVMPVSLMITADREQVSEYSKFKYAEDISYVITLLKRNKNDNIFDLPLDILSATRAAADVSGK